MPVTLKNDLTIFEEHGILHLSIGILTRFATSKGTEGEAPHFHRARIDPNGT
jgi:hypothetical protein